MLKSTLKGAVMRVIWAALLAMAASTSAVAGTMIGSWEVGDQVRPDGAKSGVARVTAATRITLDGQTVLPQLIVECQTGPNAYGRLFLVLEPRDGPSMRVGREQVMARMQFDDGPAVDQAWQPLGERSAVQDWPSMPPLMRGGANARHLTIILRGQTILFDVTGLSEATRFLNVVCGPPAATPAQTPYRAVGAWWLFETEDSNGVATRNAVMSDNYAAPEADRHTLELVCAAGRRAELIWGLPDRVRLSTDGEVTVQIDGAPPMPAALWRDALSSDFTSYPNNIFGGLAPALRGARQVTFRWKDVTATFNVTGFSDALGQLAGPCGLSV